MASGETLYWHDNLLRNVFDQYQQHENRLTHALLHTLARDQSLLDRLVRFATGSRAPKRREISLSSQLLPGDTRTGLIDERLAERRGIPDAWIYDERSRWAILLECKIRASASASQLAGHFSTARRRGFEKVSMVLLTADWEEPRAVREAKSIGPTRWLPWRDLYLWLKDSRTLGAAALADYMSVLDDRLVCEGFGGAPLTRFAGIHFGVEEPYSYQAAKVHLRNLKEHLTQRLLQEGVYQIVASSGRGAITDDDWGVWDYIAFVSEQNKQSYMRPHLTIGIGRADARIQLTLPNAAPSRYWKSLRSASPDELRGLFLDVHSCAYKLRRPTRHGFEPSVNGELIVRHFHAMKIPMNDGRLSFNVDSIVAESAKINPAVRSVSAWPSIFHGLISASRRANIQFALSIDFDYDEGSASGTPEFADCLVEAAYAFEPVHRLIMKEG